ncbi:MAG: RHS repeat-associated core domain-containing protein [Phycisphaerae bacterium]|jgi:RHS repeat-associated protein
MYHGDGLFNGFDISPFIYAATHEQGEFESAYPDGCYLCGDITGDGSVNNFDINPFTSLQNSGSTAVAYEWDAENRLVAVTPVAPTAGDRKVLFKYDYLGRRIEKAVYDWDSGGSAWEAVPTEIRRFVWSGWLMLLELDGSDDVIRKYTWGLDLAGQNGSLNSLDAAGGIGGLLAMEAPQTVGDPLKYVYMYDANGNVGQVVAWESGYGGTTGYAWDTDPASLARLVAAYEYDPYGAVVAQSGDYAAANPFRFSTKYWDDETGLGCWGRRYYDPRTGRWMSRDPIEEYDGLCLYLFAHNVPVAEVDALGLATDWDLDKSLREPWMRRPSPPPAPPRPRSGCCGPEIGPQLRDLLDNIADAFGTKNAAQKEGFCRRLFGLWNWDIDQLTSASGTKDPNPFKYEGCSTGDCDGAVQVDGSCYRANELNYILWGKANRLCRDSIDEWAPIRPVFCVGDWCLERRVGVSGWGVSWNRHTWSWAEWWIRAYRSFPGAGGNAAPVGSGTAECRAAFAFAGYYGDWGQAIGCAVDGCGTECCSEPYFGHLTAKIGPWSDEERFTSD